jgi:prevent-host-death family protein
MDRVSIVEAKRELSKVVNEAAFGHRPVVITSRGKPKAVLLSHEEFLRLTGGTRRVIRQGGLWSGTSTIGYGDLRRLRTRIWSALASR